MFDVSKEPRSPYAMWVATHSNDNAQIDCYIKIILLGKFCGQFMTFYNDARAVVYTYYVQNFMGFLMQKTTIVYTNYKSSYKCLTRVIFE